MSKEDKTQEFRVILLGKTGAGKSSLGNTLLGREAFDVARGLSSGTEKCQWADAAIEGRVLQVTDTPGLCDTHRPEEEVMREVAKSVGVAEPGPHVVLMVVRCDLRFTAEEYGAYRALKAMFGETVCKHMILIFTCIDTITKVPEPLSFPDDKVRLVLIGKTGVGKSSAGNTILGSEKFPPVRGFKSGTEKCNWQKVNHKGLSIEVTDTPGVCDTHREQHEVQAEIAKCLATVTPGPHAVLMLFKGGDRFTNEERLAYDELKELFGPDLLKHMILVFTGVDKLAEDDLDLETAIETAPGKLHEVLQEAQGRYVGFNNKGTWPEREEQRDRLLQAVRTLLTDNGGVHYSNDLMKMFEQKMQEVEKETHHDRQQIKTDVVQEESSFLGQFMGAVKNLFTRHVCEVM